MPDDQTPIRFDDRALLITGAGRGLGREIALLAASRGARVIVADNGSAKSGAGADPAPADEVVSRIAMGGGTAIACTADLGTAEGAETAVRACIDAFGRIDGIAHLASPCPDLKPPERMALGDIEQVLRVNLQAGLWLARSAWPHMVAQGGGRIVFASSAGAYGAASNADYSTAKAGVIGMMRCLAVDGAPHGIRVNAIAPAAMTRMTDGFHPGDFADWFAQTMAPGKVAPGALYLLSDEFRASGELLAIGGGRIARIVLAEADGELTAGASLEDVHEAMPAVLSDDRWFRPRDLAERSAKVAALLGYPSLAGTGDQ